MADWVSTILHDVGVIVGSVVAFWLLLRKSRDQIGKKIDKAKQDHIEITQASITRVNGALEKMMRELPYPAWIKLALPRSDGKFEFRMQYVNPAYEKWFGVALLDYVGKTDFEVWPQATAEAYFQNDMKAMGGPTAIRFREPVSQPLFGQAESHGDAMFEFEKVRIEQYDMIAVIGFMRDVQK